MQNKFYFPFNLLLFFIVCFGSTIAEAQNRQNYNPQNSKKQIDTSIFILEIDSATTVCFHNISDIHNEIDTLSKKTCSYINTKTNEFNWNMIGGFFSAISVFIMIVIFFITNNQTKNQIKQQQTNVDNQIKMQKESSDNQIEEIQTQSKKRIQTLEEIGNKIKESTAKIQQTVEHFENTYIGNDNKKNVTNSISEIENANEMLYQMLLKDFLNPVYYQDSSNPDNKKYAESVSSIKANIDKIQNIITPNKIPDPQPYLEAIQKIVNGPVFDNMDEQLQLSDIGKAFIKSLNSMVENIYNNKK